MNTSIYTDLELTGLSYVDYGDTFRVYVAGGHWIRYYPATRTWEHEESSRAGIGIATLVKYKDKLTNRAAKPI